MWHTYAHLSHYHHPEPLSPCTDSFGLSASPMTRPNTRNVHSLWTKIVCNLLTETCYPHKQLSVSPQAPPQKKGAQTANKVPRKHWSNKAAKSCSKTTLSGPLKLWWLNNVGPKSWSLINLQNATPNGAYNCSRNSILNGSSWVNFRSPSPACGLWAQHLALEEVKDILGRIFCVTAACQLSYSPWPWACWTCPLQTPAWIGFVTWSKCVKRYLAKQEAASNR